MLECNVIYLLYVMVEYILDRKISFHIYDNVTFILNLDYAVLFYAILFQTTYFHMAAVAGRQNTRDQLS
jgi:hypothetical protein